MKLTQLFKKNLVGRPTNLKNGSSNPNLIEGRPPKDESAWWRDMDIGFDNDSSPMGLPRFSKLGVPVYSQSGLYIFPKGTKFKEYTIDGEMDLSGLLEPEHPFSQEIQQRQLSHRDNSEQDIAQNPKNYCVITSIGGSDGTESSVLVHAQPDYYEFYAGRAHITEVISTATSLIILNIND
jgi:hypothetical protein